MRPEKWAMTSPVQSCSGRTPTISSVKFALFDFHADRTLTGFNVVRLIVSPTTAPRAGS